MGRPWDGSAQFTIEHPTVEIGGLLEASEKAGFELTRRVAAQAEPRIGLSTFDRKGTARLISRHRPHRHGFSCAATGGALALLSFILPVVFFSIFAVIFGGRHDTTPKVKVLLVDEDHSRISQRLVQGLEREGSLVVKTRPAPVKGAEQPEYTAPTAEAAVKAGSAPVALIIPHGFGENPISFGPAGGNRPTIQLLEDSSDMSLRSRPDLLVSSRKSR